MIMSGWILPDYTEVKCKSYANSKEHIKIVKGYIKNLQMAQPRIYEEIIKAANKLRIPNDSLDDVAVNILGWIKVNNEPYKMIYYLSGNVYETIILRYIKLGFTVVPLVSKAYIKLDHPSLYLNM